MGPLEKFQGFFKGFLPKKEDKEKKEVLTGPKITGEPPKDKFSELESKPRTYQRFTLEKLTGALSILNGMKTPPEVNSLQEQAFLEKAPKHWFELQNGVKVHINREKGEITFFNTLSGEELVKQGVSQQIHEQVAHKPLFRAYKIQAIDRCTDEMLAKLTKIDFDDETQAEQAIVKFFKAQKLPPPDARLQPYMFTTSTPLEDRTKYDFMRLALILEIPSDELDPAEIEKGVARLQCMDLHKKFEEELKKGELADNLPILGAQLSAQAYKLNKDSVLSDKELAAIVKTLREADKLQKDTAALIEGAIPDAGLNLQPIESTARGFDLYTPPPEAVRETKAAVDTGAASGTQAATTVSAVQASAVQAAAVQEQPLTALDELERDLADASKMKGALTGILDKMRNLGSSVQGKHLQQMLLKMPSGADPVWQDVVKLPKEERREIQKLLKTLQECLHCIEPSFWTATPDFAEHFIPNLLISYPLAMLAAVEVHGANFDRKAHFKVFFHHFGLEMVPGMEIRDPKIAGKVEAMWQLYCEGSGKSVIETMEAMADEIEKMKEGDREKKRLDGIKKETKQYYAALEGKIKEWIAADPNGALAQRGKRLHEERILEADLTRYQKDVTNLCDQIEKKIPANAVNWGQFSFWIEALNILVQDEPLDVKVLRPENEFDTSAEYQKHKDSVDTWNLIVAKIKEQIDTLSRLGLNQEMAKAYLAAQLRCRPDPHNFQAYFKEKMINDMYAAITEASREEITAMTREELTILPQLYHEAVGLEGQARKEKLEQELIGIIHGRGSDYNNQIHCELVEAKIKPNLHWGFPRMYTDSDLLNRYRPLTEEESAAMIESRITDRMNLHIPFDLAHYSGCDPAKSRTAAEAFFRKYGIQVTPPPSAAVPPTQVEVAKLCALCLDSSTLGKLVTPEQKEVLDALSTDSFPESTATYHSSAPHIALPPSKIDQATVLYGVISSNKAKAQKWSDELTEQFNVRNIKREPLNELINKRGYMAPAPGEAEHKCHRFEQLIKAFARIAEDPMMMCDKEKRDHLYRAVFDVNQIRALIDQELSSPPVSNLLSETIPSTINTMITSLETTLRESASESERNDAMESLAQIFLFAHTLKTFINDSGINLERYKSGYKSEFRTNILEAYATTFSPAERSRFGRLYLEKFTERDAKWTEEEWKIAGWVTTDFDHTMLNENEDIQHAQAIIESECRMAGVENPGCKVIDKVGRWYNIRIIFEGGEVIAKAAYKDSIPGILSKYGIIPQKEPYDKVQVENSFRNATGLELDEFTPTPHDGRWHVETTNYWFDVTGAIYVAVDDSGRTPRHKFNQEVKWSIPPCFGDCQPYVDERQPAEVWLIRNGEPVGILDNRTRQIQRNSDGAMGAIQGDQIVWHTKEGDAYKPVSVQSLRKPFEEYNLVPGKLEGVEGMLQESKEKPGYFISNNPLIYAGIDLGECVKDTTILEKKNGDKLLICRLYGQQIELEFKEGRIDAQPWQLLAFVLESGNIELLHEFRNKWGMFSRPRGSFQENVAEAVGKAISSPPDPLKFAGWMQLAAMDAAMEGKAAALLKLDTEKLQEIIIAYSAYRQTAAEGIIPQAPLEIERLFLSQIKNWFASKDAKAKGDSLISFLLRHGLTKLEKDKGVQLPRLAKKVIDKLLGEGITLEQMMSRIMYRTAVDPIISDRLEKLTEGDLSTPATWKEFRVPTMPDIDFPGRPFPLKGKEHLQEILTVNPRDIFILPKELSDEFILDHIGQFYHFAMLATKEQRNDLLMRIELLRSHDKDVAWITQVIEHPNRYATPAELLKIEEEIGALTRKAQTLNPRHVPNIPFLQQILDAEPSTPLVIPKKLDEAFVKANVNRLYNHAVTGSEKERADLIQKLMVLEGSDETVLLLKVATHPDLNIYPVRSLGLVLPKKLDADFVKENVGHIYNHIHETDDAGRLVLLQQLERIEPSNSETEFLIGVARQVNAFPTHDELKTSKDKAEELQSDDEKLRKRMVGLDRDLMQILNKEKEIAKEMEIHQRPDFMFASDKALTELQHKLAEVRKVKERLVNQREALVQELAAIDKKNDASNKEIAAIGQRIEVLQKRQGKSLTYKSLFRGVLDMAKTMISTVRQVSELGDKAKQPLGLGRVKFERSVFSSKTEETSAEVAGLGNLLKEIDGGMDAFLTALEKEIITTESRTSGAERPTISPAVDTDVEAWRKDSKEYQFTLVPDLPSLKQQVEDLRDLVKHNKTSLSEWKDALVSSANTAKTDIVFLERMRQGRSITWNDLVSLMRKDQTYAFGKHLGDDIEKVEIQKQFYQILANQARLYQLERVLSSLEQLVADPTNQNMMRQFYDQVSARRAYTGAKPETDVSYLFFDAASPKGLYRPVQKEKIEDTTIASEKGVPKMAELPTGSGKTDYIIVMLNQMVSKGKKALAAATAKVRKTRGETTAKPLVLNVWPRANVAADTAATQEKTASAVGGEVFELKFSREDALDSTHLVFLRSQLEKAARKGHTLSVTAEDLASINLHFVETLEAIHESKEQGAKPEEELLFQAEEYKKILHLLYSSSFATIDEAHSVLDPMQKTIYTVGKGLPCPPKATSFAIDFFDFLSKASPKFQELMEKNVTLTPSELDSAMEEIFNDDVMKQLAEKYELKGDEAGVKALKSFLKGEGPMPPEVKAKDHKDKLFLARGYFMAIVKSGIGGAVGVQFGLSKAFYGKVKFAIPYEKQGVPKESKAAAGPSCYQSIDETLFKTLRIYHTGDNFKEEHLVDLFCKYVEFSKSKNKVQRDYATEQLAIVRKQYPEIVHVNFKRLNPEKMRNLFRTTVAGKSVSKEWIGDFIKLCVAPEIKQFPKTIGFNPQDMLRMFEESVSVTATPQETLTHSLKTQFIAMAGSTGKKFDLLFTKMRGIRAIPTEEGAFLAEIAQGCKERHVRAIADPSGTREFNPAFVKKLADEMKKDPANNINYIVYFNVTKGQRVRYDIRSGTEQAYDLEAHKKALETTITLYDQARSTGTDIPQAPEAQLILLTTAATTAVEAGQGVGRMRQLDKAQTFEIWTSDSSIPRNDEMPDTDRKNVLLRKFLVNESAVNVGKHRVAMRQLMGAELHNAMIRKLVGLPQQGDTEAKTKAGHSIEDTLSDFTKFRTELVSETLYDPEDNYGKIGQAQDVKLVLEREKEGMKKKAEKCFSRSEAKLIGANLDAYSPVWQESKVALPEKEYAVETGNEVSTETQVQQETQTEREVAMHVEVSHQDEHYAWPKQTRKWPAKLSGAKFAPTGLYDTDEVSFGRLGDVLNSILPKGWKPVTKFFSPNFMVTNNAYASPTAMRLALMDSAFAKPISDILLIEERVRGKTVYKAIAIDPTDEKQLHALIDAARNEGKGPKVAIFNLALGAVVDRSSPDAFGSQVLGSKEIKALTAEAKLFAGKVNFDSDEQEILKAKAKEVTNGRELMLAFLMSVDREKDAHKKTREYYQERLGLYDEDEEKVQAVA